MKPMRSSRELTDKQCQQCSKTFRPRRASAKYCSRPCAWANNGGHNRKREVWWTNSRGYIEGRITMPDDSRRTVKQHRWLMEQWLGRILLPSEIIHHTNGNKADNRIQNLQIMETGSHSSIHNRERTYRRGYKLNLTSGQRLERSIRAKRMGLAEMGRATLKRKRNAN